MEKVNRKRIEKKTSFEVNTGSHLHAHATRVAHPMESPCALTLGNCGTAMGDTRKEHQESFAAILSAEVQASWDFHGTYKC